MRQTSMPADRHGRKDESMAENPQVKRVLMSVTDKTGVVEFAKALHDEFGAQII